MVSGYWGQVLSQRFDVPSDRPLDDLTAELTGLLGSVDPTERLEVAVPVLLAWIDRGVYDHLLLGLGDGIAAGLAAGLGETEGPSVFRRAGSALVLAACIDRDTERNLLGPAAILGWGDRVMTWLLREADVRAFVPGRGVAHAVAHGADALGALARSHHVGRLELTVVLDVVADRLLTAPGGRLLGSEVDRLAETVLHVLRRDLVGLDVLEPWVNRLAADARPRAAGPLEDPWRAGVDAQAFLRALHLQLALAPDPPEVRADLLLVLIAALRATNAHALVPAARPLVPEAGRPT